MDADGTGLTLLKSPPVHFIAPQWSPDGTKLLFEDDNGIKAINTDGTGLTQLTDNGMEPQWSPDGTKIVFTSARDASFQIYVMNADGSEQTNISNSDSPRDRKPQYSPDGTKIVFFRGWISSHSSELYDRYLYVMNSDGSDQTEILDNTVDNGFEEFIDPFVDIPIWSPDSQKLLFAYHGCSGGIFRIFTINADGTSQGFKTNLSKTSCLEFQEAPVFWAVMPGTTPPPPPTPDAIPPNTFITSALDAANKIVKNNTKTMSTTIHIYFDGTDNVAVTGFECRLDGTTWNSCTSPVTYSGLSQSKHYVEVRAVDGAGNKDQTPALFRWTVMPKP
jgi:dipeptidyl aminopeptidase/acylaminoacyl peptidase